MVPELVAFRNQSFDRLVVVSVYQSTRIDFPTLDWPTLGQLERFSPEVSFASLVYQIPFLHLLIKVWKTIEKSDAVAS
jgi:hypothetical protein